MDIVTTRLPGVLLVQPVRHTDERGFLMERFHEARFAEHGLPTHWPQENHSRSRRGVLRGLHFQLRAPQGKLVSCVRGEAYDVAVDVRVGSPTFGRWVGVTLSESSARMVWIPPGFAHGFCAVSDVVDIVYMCTEPYDAADERGVRWDDAEIAIEWPLPRPMLSARDAALPTLRAALSELPRYDARVVAIQ